MAVGLETAKLSNLKTGCYRCVEVVGDDAASSRLKRLGICEGHRIGVVQCGDPMIVCVAGARVGLSRLLAERVVVASEELLNDDACCDDCGEDEVVRGG